MTLEREGNLGEVSTEVSSRQESEQLRGESWLHASWQRELGKPQFPHLQNGNVRPATASKDCYKDEMIQNDQMKAA